MPKVTFKDEWCQTCGLCITACPMKIIKFSESRINKKGFAPAELIESNASKCTGCAMCATMCPDYVIKVEK